MIAQRVSAGFRPPMNTQPREGRQKPLQRDRQHSVASPEPDNAPAHLGCLRVPDLMPETHFHAETPSPPRFEYPS